MVYRNGGDINVTTFYWLNVYHIVNKNIKESNFEELKKIFSITYRSSTFLYQLLLIRSHHVKISIYLTG